MEGRLACKSLRSNEGESRNPDSRNEVSSEGGGAEAGPLELANPLMEEPGKLPSKRRKIKFKKLFTYIYPLNSCLQTLDGGI